MRHLLSLADLTKNDVEQIFSLSADLKTKRSMDERPQLLTARVLTQVFEKPSLRTRVSLETAMMELGGSSIFLSAQEAGLQGRESLADVARVLSGYSDAIVLRTFSQSLIEEFARQSGCPVINGLSDERHPCQALADLFTMQEVFGDVSGRRLVFVGDGNNVVASLAELSAMWGVPMTVASPPGYEWNSDAADELSQRYPTAEILQTADAKSAVRDASVIYTDVWASMGQEAEAESRKQTFAAYQVNAELMAHAPADCRFMHCLPAHRGMEVTDEVLDGPQSIAFQQAENRKHISKGLLVWILQNTKTLGNQ